MKAGLSAVDVTLLAASVMVTEFGAVVATNMGSNKISQKSIEAPRQHAIHIVSKAS